MGLGVEPRVRCALKLDLEAGAEECDTSGAEEAVQA
jgi:hypothetical protein